MDFNKAKTLLFERYMLKNISKILATDRENIFANICTRKDFNAEYIKNSYHSRRQTIQSKLSKISEQTRHMYMYICGQ